MIARGSWFPVPPLKAALPPPVTDKAQDWPTPASVMSTSSLGRCPGLSLQGDGVEEGQPTLQSSLGLGHQLSPNFFLLPREGFTHRVVTFSNLTSHSMRCQESAINPSPGMAARSLVMGRAEWDHGGASAMCSMRTKRECMSPLLNAAPQLRLSQRLFPKLTPS